MPALPLPICSLLSEAGASLAHAADVESPSLAVGPDVFAFEEPVHVTLTASNVGNLVVVSGEANVRARVDCARCLEPFEILLEASLETYFAEEDDADELREEVDVTVVEHDPVDVWPAIEAALAEVAPFAPIHDRACAGICPTCGANRNTDPCMCEEEPAESPFAVLKELDLGDGPHEAG